MAQQENVVEGFCPVRSEQTTEINNENYNED